jgi:hypothetical protein
MNGEARTLDLLGEEGLSARVLERHPGPIGPVSAARRQLLRERGLLPAEDGDHEDTVIILATRETGDS